ncbi:glycosyltransferase family 4 protein [Aetokthonos hydrillicola]|uniref:glycosyltransferase family 4 protein n=1 Tax=Aetokthonos hydrillicola TaxID=1550245 RepID=UPI001ABA208E|nr:glycosyltransferase family 4 protein [Aetokthonos hydrillicola]MBO3457604.1 glycosyltransferase [Aetokthonos hydrillicola CCALA 1050]
MEFEVIEEKNLLDSLSILHINTWGGIGGAFIASQRLHQGLLNSGLGSILAYGRVLNNSDRELTNSEFYRKLYEKNNKIEKISINFFQKIGLNDIGKISTFSLKNKDYFNKADIINFHNIHSDYFSYLALPGITKNKPAIWTLHDMWGFTGHCAYSYNCLKWQNGCGKCPYPDSQPSIQRDATRIEWKLKNWVYTRSNITIVTPSIWLTRAAQESMLNRFPIYHIPYGIDTKLYQPLDPLHCRSILGIPTGKKVLMFGAQILTDSRKGGNLLLQALAKLPASVKAETVLLTLGDGGEAISNAVGIACINLGYVSGDRLKSVAYSAADFFVFPTRADNLPLVLQESMACGTPMVSFKVGGVPDLVRPGVTGYLATPENVDDLCNGIIELWENDTLRQLMGQNCRQIALAESSLEIQAQRYTELYRQTLKGRGHGA